MTDPKLEKAYLVARDALFLIIKSNEFHQETKLVKAIAVEALESIAKIWDSTEESDRQ